ncbi:MAG: hypothetical protein AAB353_06700 [Candidatus Hydrogenedentota bacterium]
MEPATLLEVDKGIADNRPPQLSLAKTFRFAELLIIVAAAVFIVLGTYSHSFGDTADSRLSTVYALAKYGTWYIDRKPDEEPIRFEQQTIDKVVVPGKGMLSSKPPILPLIMTGEYLVMNKAFGLDLDSEEDTATIIRYMSMTLIGLSYIFCLVFFLKTLKLFVDSPLARVVCLFGLAFGTQLWGFATNINNHVPAAFLVVVSIYFALGLASQKLDPAPWRFFVFGLAAGLTPTIDMPAGIFPFAAGIYLLHRLRAMTLTWAVPGAAIPLLIHLGISIDTTGSVIPIQMHFEEFFWYEGSFWRSPQGIDILNEPKSIYLFHMLFGRVGLFLLFPVTFLGVVAALWVWPKKEHPLRPHVLAGLAAWVLLTLYYIVKTNNYGGEAYGFRWYIVAMPVLMLMAAPMLEVVRNRWQWGLIAVMLSVSFYSAWQCSYQPWGSNHEWTTRIYGRSYIW